MTTSAEENDNQQVDTGLGSEEIAVSVQELRREQKMNLAVVAGLVSSLVVAAVWAAITYATEYQISWMAIGAGWLVGFCVRKAGKGVDKSFGIVGAAFALVACLVGNVLAKYALATMKYNVSFSEFQEVIQDMGITTLVIDSPIDFLFYGLAIYIGYTTSFRELSEAQKGALNPG